MKVVENNRRLLVEIKEGRIPEAWVNLGDYKIQRSGNIIDFVKEHELEVGDIIIEYCVKENRERKSIKV